MDIVIFGNWNAKVWIKDLYCPNCQNQGYTIATGQIMDMGNLFGRDQNNPMPQSKPGQILQFPGGEIIE